MDEIELSLEEGVIQFPLSHAAGSKLSYFQVRRRF